MRDDDRTKARDDRPRDLHTLDADGMIACNPRDPEAAHRADVGDIATADAAQVTCKKCREWIRRAVRT